jgi:hypothetical protein
MKRRVPYALCIVAALTVAGCRQPDGPLPVEGAEDPNRIYDVSRDLLNVAGGDAEAPRELVEDIKVWAVSSNEPWEPGDELARRLVVALTGKPLTEQMAGQLARHIWITAAGRELSDRQIGRLQEDVNTLLVSAGATEEAAKAVADQIGVVQEAVTTKRRRWYQIS